ncbi:hypothetical protein KK141_06410 [Dyella sp. LX-66]|uniref:hypothetical protein n=1 Tax=unclassified Dyella TaxID=2634549 RepID=UPI001BDF86A9|nr:MULTISPECIES: hypothetical protein [unclassified Dyella]MBT2116663.1 hypothetical protein [Dyella sp. LX-1]MBT2139157.1 hypothetical protein [Dyella sp. LX-66]
MDLRHTGRVRPACGLAIAALLLSPAAAQAEQGRIQFTGRLVTPAAPLSVAGVHVLPDGNSASARKQLLSAALASGDIPELLRYFTGYAGSDTRLTVTTYE